MIRLDQLGQIPNWITIVVISTLTVCLLVGIPLARRAGVKAANLAGQSTTAPAAHRKERLALFAALAPSVLVWLAVMGVSFIGLTGFAAESMQWRHWTNILVPLSLDGISVSFGGWAFVAVKRGRHPGRSYRIVLAAASLSAMLNFVHGRQVWSIWAGIYLAFLSLAGMAMFHEMLDQFMATYDEEILRNAPYPRFGQRWFWAPISTLKARRAWIVYPPHEGTRPTINNALEHWRTVRRLSQLASDDTAPPSAHENGAETSEWVGALGGHADLPSTAPQRVRPHRAIEAGSADMAEVKRTSANVPHIKPTAGARAEPGAGSNAEVNEAAEQLWIEHMEQGNELTGAQLLQLFRARFPHNPRRLRWAAHRRKAAQARFAQPSADVDHGGHNGRVPIPPQSEHPASQTSSHKPED